MVNDKYLSTGALNPAWVYENERNELNNNLKECANSFLNCISIYRNIKKSEKEKEGRKEMCTIVNNNSYEDKFNFIKSHSDNPEDLKLAKEIVGIV